MKLAQEKQQPREAENTKAILEVLEKSLRKAYPEGQMLRRFHPKGHGLVEARFTVPDDIPDHLRVGLFRKAKSYDAFIRFSNAPPTALSDKRKSPKGMAIKVLNTGSETLEYDPLGQTQDFVLTTSAVLVPATVKGYLASMKGLFGGFWRTVLYAINPFHWRTLIVLARGRIKAHNLLELDYFSSTAYLMGKGQAVKWMVKARKNRTEFRKEQEHEHHIRENLQADLAKSDHYFDIGVQLQTDARKEPIENSGKRWKTPFVKLAEITIPAQEFDVAEKHEKGEKMHFSPWHCMEEHRPIGGNNRVRRSVYREMSRLRLTDR